MNHPLLNIQVEPFMFCDGCEHPRFRRDELPLAEELVRRGPIVTFRGALGDCGGLTEDLDLLGALELGHCYYGAASAPMRPFLCDIQGATPPLTARDVLTTLRARNFRSAHIRDLDATQVPFPGYCPSGGRGIDNDEIHTDFFHQHMFCNKNNDEYAEPSDAITPSSGTHGMLQSHVVDSKLWYVLLHSTPKEYEGSLFSDYVMLFAVGLSRNGDRLLGAVTHQVCHNLCD